jgi:hypothetical protein
MAVIFVSKTNEIEGTLQRSPVLNLTLTLNIRNGEAENAHDNYITQVQQQPRHPPRGGRGLPRLPAIGRHCEEPTGRRKRRPMTGSATKQSILPLRGAMDCFAEPVIGRAFARPVGSQ